MKKQEFINYTSRATVNDIKALIKGEDTSVFFEDNLEEVKKIISELKPAQIGKIQAMKYTGYKWMGMPPSVEKKINDMARYYSLSHRDGTAYDYSLSCSGDGNVYYEYHSVVMDKICLDVYIKTRDYIMDWAKKQPVTFKPKLTKREINEVFDKALRTNTSRVIEKILEVTNKLMAQEGSKTSISFDNVCHPKMDDEIFKDRASDFLDIIASNADLRYNAEIGVFTENNGVYTKIGNQNRDNKYSKMLLKAKANFIKDLPE